MTVLESAFWVAGGLLAYLHGGYALLLGLLSLRDRKHAVRRPRLRGSWPAVTVLVGAYNEESVIAGKLESLLAQDYEGILQTVVISDRSEDATEEIVRGYSERGIRLVVAPERRGKAANFSQFIPDVESEFVVLTDAGGVFAPDVVRRLVLAFDEPEIGCVGARIVYRNVDASGVSRGEGLYWRYEVLLRTLESRLGGTVIVSGGCYAIRRQLFRPVPPELPDDFMSPLNVCDQGYRVSYEPGALVWENMAETIEGEFRTKIRIISRNFSALRKMRHLLVPWRRPMLACKLWSHRLLRWLVVPLLAVAMVINSMLLSQTLYQVLMVAQFGFYFAALLGWVPAFRRFRVFWIPFYFCLVNLAAIIGVWKALTNRVSGTWEPVERHPMG